MHVLIAIVLSKYKAVFTFDHFYIYTLGHLCVDVWSVNAAAVLPKFVTSVYLI
jgi:hypothetical protein